MGQGTLKAGCILIFVICFASFSVMANGADVNAAIILIPNGSILNNQSGAFNQTSQNLAQNETLIINNSQDTIFPISDNKSAPVLGNNLLLMAGSMNSSATDNPPEILNQVSPNISGDPFVSAGIVAAGTDIPLNSSNMRGTTGYKYWYISSPGSYFLDIPESNFVTQAQFGIIITSSNVVVDGRGKTISGGTWHSYADSNNPLGNSYGVWVNPGYDTNNILVKNLTVKDKTYGIQYVRVNNGRIENSVVTNNGAGIFFSESTYNVVTRVNADANALTGIFLRTASSNNTITLNTANYNIDPNDPGNLARGYGIELDTDCNGNTISDNTVTGNSQVGIYQSNSNYNTVEGNNVMNNYYGIHSDLGSHGNFILNNTAASNQWGIVLDPATHNNYISLNKANNNQNSGIFVYGSSDNVVDQNTATGNVLNGIFLRDSSKRNTLTFNLVTGSSYGIELDTTTDFNVIRTNTISNCNIGMYLYGSNDNTVEGNSISTITQTGILSDYYSSRNLITGNTIKNGQFGIIFGHGSDANTIKGNQVTDASNLGIYFEDSLNSLIYNNYFKNNANAGFGSTSINTWNIPKTQGTNIVGGPFIGGNFWAQPNGAGFSEITPDSDGDGICDMPYMIGYGITDSLPLHMTSNPQLPDNAEITANSIPSTMNAYQSYPVTITVKNTGTNTWNRNLLYRLGGVGDGSGVAILFGPTRINLPTGTTVGPGQSYTFSFTMTAPGTTGAYIPKYQMVRDGVAWFGQTLSRSIQVTTAPPSDGENHIGVYRPSTHSFYLDYNGNGAWNGAVIDRQYNFGITGDIPVSGDWNSDERTEVGVYRPSTHSFYLDYNGNGAWNGAVIDRQYDFGTTGDIPVSGDWNSDERTEVGVYRPSTHSFYLDYNGNGAWNGAVIDRQYDFGTTGDIPVSGDWNNDERTEAGVYRPSTHSFYLDYNGNGAWNGAVIDRQYDFGTTGDIPVSGDWDHDGYSKIGVFRPSTHIFYLDYSGNGAWNGALIDRAFNFGINGDYPVAGVWN